MARFPIKVSGLTLIDVALGMNPVQGVEDDCPYTYLFLRSDHSFEETVSRIEREYNDYRKIKTQRVTTFRFRDKSLLVSIDVFYSDKNVTDAASVKITEKRKDSQVSLGIGIYQLVKS